MTNAASRPPSPWPRFILAMFVALALVAIAAVTMLGFSTRNPAVALALEELSGAADVKTTEMAARVARGPQSIPTVKAAAIETLQREPLDINAARTMASVTLREENSDLAHAIFTLVGRQTLRAPLVHLYLLGETFARQEWDAFQREAETIIATRPAMRDEIMGMFAQLVDQGLDTPRFRARLAQSPEWRAAFFSTLGGTASNGDRIYALMKDQKARGAAPDAEELRVWLLNELGRSDASVLAQRWRDLQTPALPEKEQLLRNPDLEGSVAPAPFDWNFVPGERAFAEIGPSPEGNGKSLYVELTGRDDAVVAFQTLDLAPGSYRLTAQLLPLSELDDEQMQFTLACAQGNRFAPVATGTPQGEIDEWSEWAWEFAVPQGCAVQQLIIGFDADFISADIAAYFDDFSLQPLTRR